METAEAATGLLRSPHAADLLVVGASPAGHRRLLGALTDRMSKQLVAIIGVSRSAQIIVLGAHHSDDPWSIRRGSVTCAVLDEAACSVITVAPLGVPAAL